MMCVSNTLVIPRRSSREMKSIGVCVEEKKEVIHKGSMKWTPWGEWTLEGTEWLYEPKLKIYGAEWGTLQMQPARSGLLTSASSLSYRWVSNRDSERLSELPMKAPVKDRHKPKLVVSQLLIQSPFCSTQESRLCLANTLGLVIPASSIIRSPAFHFLITCVMWQVH